MKKPLTFAAAIFAVIVGNAFLLYQTMHNGAVSYAAIEEVARLVNQRNADLDASVLSLRLGLVQDYDDLARCQNELQKSLHDYFQQEHSSDDENRVERLQGLVRDKVSLAADFKANHAVVRNSLAGFRHYVEKTVAVESDCSQWKHQIARFETLGLKFAMSGLDKDRQDFCQTLDAMKKTLDENTLASSIREPLVVAVQHANVLIDRRMELDATIASLVDLPIQSMTQRLIETASATFRVRSAIARKYSIALLVSIFSIVAFAIYQYRSLRNHKKLIQRANENLEQKVRARTKELANANKDLQYAIAEADKLALVARYTDNAVVITDADGRVDWVNHSFFNMTGFTLGEVQGDFLSEYLHGPDTDEAVAEQVNRAYQNRVGFDVEMVKYRKSGERFYMSIEGRPISSQQGVVNRYILIESDITSRVEAELESQRLNDELVKASRVAGIAEAATGVLHNVGNVLNSVNVSACLIQQRFRNSALQSLNRLSSLLDEHGDTFGHFVSTDARGQQLPRFLSKVTEAIHQERKHVASELQDLVSNVDHIKTIVSAQQSSARSKGLIERVQLADVIDAAINANRGSLSNHGIRIHQRMDDALPEIQTDKHKLLQILINLISNAKDAIKEHSPKDARVTISARTFDGKVVVDIQDTGVGISSEQLARIFRHGFTTKQHGHGFGLHSSANFATELGGSLSALSGGIGHGATFRLSLPVSVNSRSLQTEGITDMSSLRMSSRDAERIEALEASRLEQTTV